MKPTFKYTTSYTLDKTHFSETYDESVTIDNSLNPYKKALILAIIGLALLYLTNLSAYFAWFIIALGAIELLSVRFQKAWWLARQLISKAANNKLTLTIDEQGIHSQSLYVNSTIPWHEIIKIEQTRQGWLLQLNKGKTYLSNRCLSEEVKSYLIAAAEKNQQSQIN